MKNLRLELSFDGTAYHGWQVQKNTEMTVQNMLYKALSAVCRPEGYPTGCGRTDAGVHAHRYTASVYAESSVPLKNLPAALNANLPDDIRCFGAEEAGEDFNALISAKRKIYTYYIDNSPVYDPLRLRYCYNVRQKLDTEKMRSAAEHFCGNHDFYGFSSSGRSTKTTVRTMYRAEVLEEGSIIALRLEAEGFLYNMARIIAGTLIFCGLGRIAPEDIPGIIQSRRRDAAGPTAPAKGLFLTEVIY